MRVVSLAFLSFAFALMAHDGAFAASSNPVSQSGFGTSSREPIQIDADSLEVLDQEQRAIYQGNVIVKQGQTTMKAQKVTVIYDRRGSTPLGAKAATAPQVNMNENTALRKVEAEGGVAVFSQDQVATGDRAVYDRTTDIVTMTGNVTLSKGKNVTRGQRLVFNVGTGIATMAAGAGGRVSSSFTPSEEPVPPKSKKP
jgi:lipopolysaccharide export system protein LptA